MGDRANVFVIDDLNADETPRGVFLYAHWGGEELPQIVQRAFARKQRWDDPPYLARIIFCEMVRGFEDGETGFGISSVIGDNEHLIITVDPDEERISFCHPERLFSDGVEKSAVASWSFEEYIALSPEVLEKAWFSDTEADGNSEEDV